MSQVCSGSGWQGLTAGVEGLAKLPGDNVEEGASGTRSAWTLATRGVFDSHLAKAIGSRGKMLGTGRAGGMIRAPGKDVTLPAAQG